MNRVASPDPRVDFDPVSNMSGRVSQESEHPGPASVPIVTYEQSTGALRRVYDRFGVGQEPLDHILAVHSLNPPSMEHHQTLYAHLMRGPGPLSRVQREMIAVVVSAENECFY